MVSVAVTAPCSHARRVSIVAVAVLVVIGGVAVIDVAAAPPDIADIVESVAVVETMTSRGAGFLVAGGLVVTAEHVIGSGSAKLTFGSRSVSGHVIASDHESDLSLIELDDDVDLAPLTVTSDAPRIGEEVYAIGAPTDGDLTITRGIISAVFDDVGVQTDASVNPGNSGGPLIRSSDGTVIGVITQKADGEGIGYAMGAAAINALIRDRDGRSSDPDGSGSRQPTDEPGSAGPSGGVPGTDDHADDRAPVRVTDRRSTWALVGGAGGLAAVALVALVILSRSGRQGDDFEVSVGPVPTRTDPSDPTPRGRWPNHQGGN